VELFIIFEATGREFTPRQKGYIGKIIEETAIHCGELLRIEGTVNFHVFLLEKPIFDSDLLAIEGRTETRERICIDIPPGLVDEVALKGIVYHEMHHVKRDYSFASSDLIRLLDAVFAEGLATVFEREQVRQRVPKYSLYNVNSLNKFFNQLRTQKWNTNSCRTNYPTSSRTHCSNTRGS